MSKKKKSFLLHIDSLDILDDLEDQQVSNLFRAIKAFHKGEDFEIDNITRVAFIPFKNQFIRDDEKYIETCKRRAEAGSKGGQAKVANASKSKQKQANLADSDNKNKKDNKNKSDSDSKNKDPVANAPKYSQDDYDCAVWILSLIRQLNPKFKEPNLKIWADDIRKIVNIDKRTYQEISDLFMWVNRDDFWSSNILSPAKLRKQWDKIYMRANSTPRASTKTQGNLEACQEFLNG